MEPSVAENTGLERVAPMAIRRVEENLRVG